MSTIDHFIDSDFIPWAVICSIAVLCAMLVYIGWSESSERFNRPKYEAWMKATGNTNLTLSEWKLLKNDHLLPGQVDTRSKVQIVEQP